MFKLGFTLAELLVALAILAVITTFAIPKILSSQQEAKSNAIAKEFAGMVSGAYQQYKFHNTRSAATTTTDLVQYMNIVAPEPTLTIDNDPAWGPVDCSTPPVNCVRLHNGAVAYYNTESFGGTTTDNVLAWGIDPDGQVSDIKSIIFFLRYNGRLQTAGEIPNMTVHSSLYTYTTTPADDPSWFSW